MSRIFSRAGLAIAVIALILVVAIIGYTTGRTGNGGQAIAAPGSPGEGVEGGVVSPLDDPAAFGPPTDTDPAPDITSKAESALHDFIDSRQGISYDVFTYSDFS